MKAYVANTPHVVIELSIEEARELHNEAYRRSPPQSVGTPLNKLVDALTSSGCQLPQGKS